MMFLAEEVRGTFRLSLFCDCGFCDCGAFVLLAACPAATAAEVTASPERKSLRFMGPHFRVKGNAEGYQMQPPATSFRNAIALLLRTYGSVGRSTPADINRRQSIRQKIKL